MPTPGNPVYKKQYPRLLIVTNNMKCQLPVCKKTVPEASDCDKHTMKCQLPGSLCKKTVRETCDVQKHTMKCQLPGILCVKNNTRRVFGPKMRPAPQRESFPGNPVCKKTVREACDVQKHTMKCKLPEILCVKKQYAGGCRLTSARHQG